MSRFDQDILPERGRLVGNQAHAVHASVREWNACINERWRALGNVSRGLKWRLIPMSQTLTSTLKTATRYVRCPWVFVNPAKVESWQVNPEQVDPRYHATSITHAFERACRKAGVTHATFHDLRHTFVTNARRAGIDYFRIMAITGHKTMAVFKRYNTIDRQDLQAAIRQLDIYMDTMNGSGQQDIVQTIGKIDVGR